MNTSVILVIIIIWMQLITLVNITIFNGEWNGIALMLSSILFFLAMVVFGISQQRNKQKNV
ncbi:hypothetical protein [Pseudalkalibacillus sp. SCS-8]|uniref:hypothetical protein n=1 Tax=Pseudalkalibacillus nanhaiensis TaxID=3115291 RepID=UPI0032DA7557